MNEFIKEHEYSEIKIHDCHYHNGRQYKNSETAEHFRKHREYLNLEKMLVLALTEGATTYDPSSNIKALFSKEDDKDNMYTFASLHHFHDERDTEECFLQQIKFFKELGFDGVKMLEGKAEYNRIFPDKLDSELYRSFFKFAEETEFPILIHAGDLANCEEMKILVEEVHTEVENVLERYPKLHVTFAHLLFLFYQRERLEKILDTYPNVTLDLAIGGNFLGEFAKDIEAWRKFFIKYSDRILFATDNWNMFFEGDDDFEVTCRYIPLRDFFEKEEEFTTRTFGKNAVFKPALLPKEAVDNIYRNNFVRLFGEKPCKVNYSLALKYAKWTLSEYEKGNFKTYLRAQEMPCWYTETEKYNLAHGTELAIENLEEIVLYYENTIK